MLQLLSAPLQGGIGFLQRSVAPHLINLPYGRPSSEEERRWVYHVPLKQRWMIQPLPNTPAVIESMCPHTESGQPDCAPFG